MKIWKTLLLTGLFGLPVAICAQPAWTYNNTGINHTILILNSIPITINGNTVSAGDYIGVFYSTTSGLSCGGYMQWTGNTMTIAAWGSDPGQFNGFASGEEFKWKIWRASDSIEFTAIAVYNTTAFIDSGRYVTNGMSGLSSLTAQSQVYLPSWHFTNTGNFHLFVIPDTILITMNNQPISNGDYIGVFYDSLGTPACGGYIVWNGNFQYLYAYGQSLPYDNGFSPGELVTWKIWRISDGNELSAHPVYDLINYSDSGNYKTGGVSGLVSLVGISGPDLAITGWITPNSACQALTSNEQVTVKIYNPGNVNIDGFDIKLTVNGTQLLSQNVTLTVNYGSTVDFSFSGTVDFSNIDTFLCQVEIILPGDINPANNVFVKQVINYPAPVVTINGLNNQYCSGLSAIALHGSPAGGVFYGAGVTGNQFFPSLPGINIINYSYTDLLTGCSGSATQSVTVIQSPVFDLGPDQLHCFGESILLEVPAGFESYNWSSGETSDQMYATASGYYSVTVTASNGCKHTDVVHLTFNPVPTVHITGNTFACQGDTITLDAGPGYDIYIWNDSSSLLLQTLKVTETGNYFVKVFLNNCTATDSLFVTFFPAPLVEIQGPDSGCTGKKLKLQATEGYPFYFWNNSVGMTSSIQVTHSGIYSVSVSDENGCFGYDSIQVSFFESPVVVFPQFTGLCSGDTIILNPGKADSYLWSTGSVNSTLPVFSTGIYSVTVTSNNCSGSDSVMVYFYDLPVADFTFIQTVNEIKFDNSSSISGSYFWEFGDGITSTEFQPEHVYTQPGRYLVKLTVANDCGISLFTDSITVDHLFSGKLIDFSSIEPNPNNGDFNLHIIVEQQTDAAVSIYGLSGQMIISPENHVLQRGENLLKFSLNTLPDGMYILRLSCNYGQIYQRFFIVTF